MLEVLAEQLWEAQRGGKAPDENAYLERLRSHRLSARPTVAGRELARLAHRIEV